MAVTGMPASVRAGAEEGAGPAGSSTLRTPLTTAKPMGAGKSSTEAARHGGDGRVRGNARVTRWQREADRPRTRDEVATGG